MKITERMFNMAYCIYKIYRK